MTRASLRAASMSCVIVSAGFPCLILPDSCFTVGFVTAAEAATGVVPTGSMTVAAAAAVVAGGPAEWLATLVSDAGVVVVVIAGTAAVVTTLG
jgi:hypothetical protein